MSDTATSQPAPIKTRFCAVVIGGSSGIGKAVVKLLLKREVKVVFADLDQAKGDALKTDLIAQGLTFVDFVKASVTDSASLKALVSHAHGLFGTIHFAVNTAGVTGPMVQVREMTDEQWRMVLDIDLEGAWRFSSVMIKYFREQTPRTIRHDKGEYWGPVTQRGSLVNIASSLSTEGIELLGAYCAAKHGLVGLTKVMALENAAHGIRVNVISMTLTPIYLTPDFDIKHAQKAYLGGMPMTRFAHPDEIASAIVFTVMDGASFMTGANWGPDGGHHLD